MAIIIFIANYVIGIDSEVGRLVTAYMSMDEAIKAWIRGYYETLNEHGVRHHDDHTAENVPCALKDVLRTEHITCLTREAWQDRELSTGEED